MAKKKKPNILKRAKVAAQYVFRYAAAEDSRYRQTKSRVIRSEEIELNKHDRDTVVATALQYRRDNPIVNSISRLRKADVVGKGIMPQPDTGNDELNAEIESQWLDFSAAPETTGQMDMRELQQQMVDGLLFYADDGLIINPRAVEFVDGSRIGNPQGQYTANEKQKYQNGVEIDKRGKPVRYWIGDRVNGTLRNVTPSRAENFIHFFRRSAPIQYRGIPELAPILNLLKDIDEYDKIEMIAAKAAAALSVTIENENPQDLAAAMRLGADEQDEDYADLEQIEPGTYQYLRPGERANVISTNGRPNVDGVQWVSYLLRKCGSAVGIPLEFLLMEIGGSSFSASQGVVLQYQQTVESYQSDLIRVLNRLYRRWLTQKIASNDIRPVGDSRPFNVRWQRPGFRWINRQAQVQADLAYYRSGVMSLGDIAAPFGYDAEEVMRRKANEIKRAKAIAADMLGSEDDWREIINPFPTSVSGNLAELNGQQANGDV